MRYKDWDVLLFEQSSPVPLQEFRVACYVVQDTESLSPQAPGIPTVTCFVPSLEPDTPFKISIHSWKKPTIDQLVENDECSAIGVRLFIDGGLVTSTFVNGSISWPFIISHMNAKRFLEFPIFQEALLCQRHWSAADDLGRIKIVISEGVCHGSQDDMTFETVRDLVSFSFQHAPQAVLEEMRIAWPNPSMWQQPQQSSTVSQANYNFDLKDQGIIPQSLYEFQGQAASECNDNLQPGTPLLYLDHQSAVKYANAPINATMSPYNHAVPPHIQDATPHMSTPELQFRKDNGVHVPAWPDSPMFADATFALRHQTQRQVLQQMYTPSNGNMPMPLVQPQIQNAAINGSTRLGRGKSAANAARLLVGAPTHISAQQPFLDAPKPPTKRVRADTPESADTLENGDYEDQVPSTQSNSDSFRVITLPGDPA